MSGIQKCFACLIAIVAVCRADQPVANTKYGSLRGLEMRSRGSPNVVKAFLGVPYAQPPVGDLRLTLPQPPSPWEGVRDATQYGSACPQHEYVLRGLLPKTLLVHNTGVSEDCLSLDVYTPDLDGKRPVLAVLHGGGFIFGKSTFFINGTSLAAHEDIVVVSIQYRLGALGNLYSAEGTWPSNLALRDQQSALRWVQDNIAAFGGDPGKVTFNGESSGGMSVSAHVLAPSSQGLFQRAIVQSGSIFSIWNTKDSNPQTFTDKIAASLRCPANDSEETLACLRQKSVDEILEAQVPVFPLPCIELVWDGDFLPDDPFKAYREGSYSRVDYMAGVTSNEGFALMGMFVPELLARFPHIDKWERQLATALELTFGRTDNVYQLMHTALGDEEDTEVKDTYWIRQKVTDILGEYTLQAPTYLSALFHSDAVNNTYFYEFAHKPSFLDPTMRPPWHHGCDHAYDLIFAFGLPLVENFLTEDAEPMTDEECDFSRVVLKYIANFVKTGNPNSEGLPTWGAFSKDHKDYQILQPEVKGAIDYKADAMDFWIEKLKAIHKDPLKTEDNKPLHDEL